LAVNLAVKSVHGQGACPSAPAFGDDLLAEMQEEISGYWVIASREGPLKVVVVFVSD
jgi:hypothetical protein